MSLAGRPRTLALNVAGAALALAASLSACKQREGLPYRCDCDWLTDYDDPAKQSAIVCAENDKDALEVGLDCAQRSAPAPIQRCTCARAPASAAGSSAIAQAASGTPQAGACRRGCIETQP